MKDIAFGIYAIGCTPSVASDRKSGRFELAAATIQVVRLKDRLQWDFFAYLGRGSNDDVLRDVFGNRMQREPLAEFQPSIRAACFDGMQPQDVGIESTSGLKSFT
mgnify:CR=1 FL=1